MPTTTSRSVSDTPNAPLATRPVRAPITTSGTNRPPTPPPPKVAITAVTG